MADDEPRGFKLFAGNSHPDLAQKIAEHLGIEVGEAVVDRFKYGDGAVLRELKKTRRWSVDSLWWRGSVAHGGGVCGINLCAGV